VIWTQTARKQRREVLRYWKAHNRSATYSRKLIAEIQRRMKIIVKRPLIFRESEFPETRVSPMGHFSILYRITEREIVVVAFWDNRDDPEKLEKLILNQ